MPTEQSPITTSRAKVTLYGVQPRKSYTVEITPLNSTDCSQNFSFLIEGIRMNYLCIIMCVCYFYNAIESDVVIPTEKQPSCDAAPTRKVESLCTCMHATAVYFIHNVI